MYGKITNNKIKIATVQLEGYKPIVEERPTLEVGQECKFYGYVENEDSISKVYVVEGQVDTATTERLGVLESAVMELGELVSSMEGGSTDGEVVS